GGIGRPWGKTPLQGEPSSHVSTGEDVRGMAALSIRARGRPQRLKPHRKPAVTAALKRCATQNQGQRRVLPQAVKPRASSKQNRDLLRTELNGLMLAA